MIRTLRGELTLAIASAIALAGQGCSEEAVPPTGQDTLIRSSEETSVDEEQLSLASRQDDGVWIFYHSEPGGDDAEHQGQAAILDGCLTVGEAVVIWRGDQAEQVAEILAAVRAGRAPLVSVGGSEVAYGSFTPEMRAHCTAASSAWFASRDLEVVTE